MQYIHELITEIARQLCTRPRYSKAESREVDFRWPLPLAFASKQEKQFILKH